MDRAGVPAGSVMYGMENLKRLGVSKIIAGTMPRSHNALPSTLTGQPVGG
jgi:hypothetical protein